MTFVFGREYATVEGLFGLLCVYALLLVQGTVLGNVFFGIGEPGKHRAFVGLRVVILAALIYPGIRFFGLTGAAAVLVLASFVAMCVQVIVIRKTIGLNTFDYAISWAPGLALTAPVVVVVVILRVLMPDSPTVHLTVGVLSCIIAYVIGMIFPKLFDKRQLHQSTGCHDC